MSSTAAAGEKEKGNLTGKKETIIVNGRSLFVVGHYHDETFVSHSEELFPFPFFFTCLNFSLCCVATWQRVRLPLAVYFTQFG